MTQYGSIPGVRITTESGTISGVTIGREQYHILVGAGSVDGSGSAAVNDPINIAGTDDAEAKFGADSDLANGYDRATNNGASPDLVVGIKAETTTHTETLTEFTNPLANIPLLANVDRISAEDGSQNSVSVNLSYAETPDAPAEDSYEVVVNPHNGVIKADPNLTEVTIDYETADWASALGEIKPYLLEGDFDTTKITNSCEY